MSKPATVTLSADAYARLEALALETGLAPDLLLELLIEREHDARPGRYDKLEGYVREWMRKRG